MSNRIAAENAIRKLFYDRYKGFLANGIPSESIDPPVFTDRVTGSAYTPEIKWHNTEKITGNTNDKHWMRFSLQNVLQNQKSLAGGRQQAVGTKFTTKGVIKVELYFSKSSYVQEQCDVLSFIVERCFVQANADGAWFRNFVAVDLPPEETHFRTNVLSEYEYDTCIQ